MFFAQGQIPDFNTIINLVTTGGFGALAWYLIAKHIPSQAEKFTKDLEKQDEKFVSELHRQRVTFLEAINKQQDNFAEIVNQERTHFKVLIDMVREDTHKVVEAFTKQLNDVKKHD